jgi:hypothetical protein
MQHVFGQYGTASMRIKVLQIQATGTYGQQYSRPFQSQFTGAAGSTNLSILDSVAERVVASRGGITGAMFSTGPGVNLITPSATPERDIGIANGWGTKRLRFVLQIDRNDHMGTAQYISVSGFTDHADLSLSNRIDPRTRFYINSVSVANPVRIKNPYGVTESIRPVSSNQLVVNRDSQGALVPGVATAYSIAPDSVFSTLQAAEYSKGLHGDSMLDTRPFLTGSPRLMQRQHNSAPQYCASILETWNSVNNASEFSHSSDRIMEECIQTLEAPMAQDDPFISFLMRRNQQEYGYSSNFDGSFKYDDLLALDANVENVKHLVPDIGGLHYAGQSCNWSSSDGITLAASALAQAVPSYMAQVGIDVFRFNATNNQVGGQILVLPVAVSGFGASMDQRAEVEALCFRLKNEVLSSVTYGNQVSFTLEMHVDLYGETWIELSMNGESPGLYVSPTFADSLVVPTVTINNQRINGICHDLGAIFNKVWDQKVSNSADVNLTKGIRI